MICAAGQRIAFRLGHQQLADRLTSWHEPILWDQLLGTGEADTTADRSRCTLLAISPTTCTAGSTYICCFLRLCIWRCQAWLSEGDIPRTPARATTHGAIIEQTCDSHSPKFRYNHNFSCRPKLLVRPRNSNLPGAITIDGR